MSVVLCTWNRASLLRGALDCLVGQAAAPADEIVVVDNNSTDETAQVVRSFESYPHLRYVFEPQAGLSHARNAGVAATTGELVAFTDDDVRVPPHWVAAIHTVAERYPEAACFGGPVLPEWTTAVPAWLTEEQWIALGVQDHSQEPFRADLTRQVCLIGANLIIRRAALARVGPFDPAVQRVGNGIGSTEDHEYHRRLWDAGLHGVYDPALEVRAIVTEERLAKGYHRKWHFGHGRHIARMRLPDVEQSRYRPLGIPAHLLRQFAADMRHGIASVVRGDRARAFERELRLWFTAGFIRERIRNKVAG